LIEQGKSELSTEFRPAYLLLPVLNINIKEQLKQKAKNPRAKLNLWVKLWITQEKSLDNLGFRVELA